MSIRTRISTVLTFFSLILLVGAGALYATGSSLADDPKASQTIPPPWERPAPTAIPRPIEGQAKSLNAAKQDFLKEPGLSAVIKSAEAGDVDALLKLARRVDNYCGQSRRLPSECSSREDDVDAVYIDSGEITPRALATMKRWLDALLSNGGSSLDFVSRDSRFPEGKGGKYYLVFRAPELSAVGEGNRVNALRLVVFPGADQPIQWIGFMGAQGNGLQWIQDVDNSETAPYQILLAPASVKDWPAIRGPGRQP